MTLQELWALLLDCEQARACHSHFCKRYHECQQLQNGFMSPVAPSDVVRFLRNADVEIPES